MRAVMSLLVLLAPALSGCLGADAGPSNDACGHCTSETPTSIRLASFTWDQPNGRPGRTYEEDVAPVDVPDGVRHVVVEVTRDHGGYEKAEAQLTIRVQEGQMGSAATFDPTTPWTADRQTRDMGFGWHGHGEFQLRYQYEAQPKAIGHKLWFDVTGYT